MKDYFRSQIAKKVLPLNSESKEILEKQPAHLFQGRKLHDIYDKIRNIIGRK